MIDLSTVQDFCQKVVEKFQPDKIILFGSYAYGEPTLDSDIDLLVVLPFEGEPAKTAAKILITIDYHFPLDLLARTSEQIQQRIEMGDFFMQEIVQKGRVLYEADYARVG